MDLASTAVDVSKEDDGEWVDLSQFDAAFADPDNPEKNLWVLVRSVRSPQYQRVNARLRRKIERQQLRNAPIDPVLSDKLTREALAEAALLGWRNLQENGQDIPFTRENAARIMTDRRYRRFHDAVAKAAVQVGEGDAEWLERNEGNLRGESVAS